MHPKFRLNLQFDQAVKVFTLFKFMYLKLA